MATKFFPENTARKVIVKSVNCTFDKKSYSLEHLNQFLSKEDFEEIIGEVNKLVSKSFYIKKKNESTSLGYFSISVVGLSFLLTLTYILLLYYSTSGDVNSQTGDVLFIISTICMCAVLILVFLLSLLTYISKIGKLQSLDEIIKTSIDQYLGYINNYFESYMEWIYVQTDQYIEINILDTPFKHKEGVIEECDEENENCSIENNPNFNSSQFQVNTERQLMRDGSNNNNENKNIHFKKKKNSKQYSIDSIIRSVKHGRSVSMMDKMNVKNKLK